MQHCQQIVQLEAQSEKNLYQELGLGFHDAGIKNCFFKKIFNSGSDNYLTGIFLKRSRFYHTKPCEHVPNFRLNHNFLKNWFFPSIISEWNKLDLIRNSENISIFKQNSLQFIRPSPNPIFNCQMLLESNYLRDCD